MVCDEGQIKLSLVWSINSGPAYSFPHLRCGSAQLFQSYFQLLGALKSFEAFTDELYS